MRLSKLIVVVVLALGALWAKMALAPSLNIRAAAIAVPEFGGWAAAQLLKAKIQSGWSANELQPLHVRKVIYDEVLQGLKPKWKKQTKTICDAIIRSANRHEMDPILVLAVMMQESRLNPRAVGTFGEIGLLQIRPTTARWIAKRNKIKPPSRQELFRPEVNIEIGTAYLAYLRDQLGQAYFIHAYNQGPNGMRRTKTAYFKKVVSHYRSLMAALFVTERRGFASFKRDEEPSRSYPLISTLERRP